MWERLQRYKALDPEARRVFRRAVMLLAEVRAWLRLRGYKRTQLRLQKRLERVERRNDSALRTDDAGTAMVCRMVSSGARYGFTRPTCLEESLALWYFLRERGSAAKIRIGVRKADGRFDAHAWVELNGVALNQHDGNLHHYAAFENEFMEFPAETP